MGHQPYTLSAPIYSLMLILLFELLSKSNQYLLYEPNPLGSDTFFFNILFQQIPRFDSNNKMHSKLQ